MNTNYKLAFVLLLFGCLSCDISDNEIDPTTSFLKIYDHQSFDASFIPIDIKQAATGEFLILGARRIEGSDFLGVFLLKVDEFGAFVSSRNLSDQYVHPVNSLINIEEQYYFVAMNSTSLQATLITVDLATLDIIEFPIAGISYPMHVSQRDSEMLLLSYNNTDKTSNLSIVNTEGNVTAGVSYSIGAGEDIEVPIIEHFTRTGRQLPFFAGVTNNGLYYFNGFYNYTLSLVFTDLSGDALGVLQGQQDNGGISATQHIEGSTFALSRFNFGDNYIVPRQDVSINGLTSSSDITGNPFPELVDDAAVVLDLIMVGNESVLLYASNTKTGKIILMSYNSTNGELISTKYIGFSDPYSVAAFTATADGGLAVLGTVQVAGRFARISMIKLSKEELSELR